MEQRPLRLGDIVDDYCPRERRVTNHVIVALVEDAIRQTRCTTCDTEHVFRGAKEPRRRKKDGTSELYDQVLADLSGGQLVAPPSADQAAPLSTSADRASHPETNPETSSVPNPDGATGDEPRHEDGWPAHRQLIRAQLPRVEGEQPVPRPIPEFTMHQRPQGRGGYGFRYAGSGGANGNGPQRNGFGQGRPQGHGQGNAPGQGRPGQNVGRAARRRGNKPRPR